jgi:CRISPR-associated protein (TIGR03986 family)
LEDSFLAQRSPRSWSATHRSFWYADLTRTRFHWKRIKEREFCIGLDLAAHRPEDRESPPLLAEEEWKTLPEPAGKRYTRGVLLVLGLDGSKPRNLPPTKKHEYFLPFEEGKVALLELPEEVVTQFCSLAEDAAELPRGGDAEDFPYLHQGRERPTKTGGKARWKPQPGDLVYFERGGHGRVQRIAYSALWRLPVRGGNLHGSIARVSPDLVPFHKDRDRLTLAERLFGFVETNGKRALAGRVRFSHALAAGEPRDGGWYEPEVTLKILAAPKPPSPALYFGHYGYLAKRDLDLDRHRPQGRKVYLHHREEDIEARCYETKEEASDKAKLKMKVRPLQRGTVFYFHVDFHNLTREELGHLLYALRPTTQFRHKLGLGKPLGLGRVRIDPLTLCFIDREACYRPQGLFAAKYAACDAKRSAPEWSEWLGLTGALDGRYRHEREVATSATTIQAGWPNVEELAAEARGRIPQTVRHALELVGDPGAVNDHLVTYPVTLGQTQEGEHFRWFVSNDKDPDGKQALKALQPGQPLPTLRRLRPPRE